jgi:hypothetical protein
MTSFSSVPAPNSPLHAHTIQVGQCIPLLSRHEHLGHSFERLSAVYERHVEIIRSEDVGLWRRLKDLCTLVSETDKNIERVHKVGRELIDEPK